MNGVLPGVPEVSVDRERSAFFTPPKTASRLVAWSGAKSIDHVLEPSAGMGALVKPLLEMGCTVDAWEIDEASATAVRGLCSDAQLRVFHADFLEMSALGRVPGRYHVTVANPPYEDNQDVRFVEAALMCSSRVVGLFQSRIVHSKGRAHFWRWHNIDRLAVLSERPRCGGEHSPKTDFVALEITRRAVPRKQGEATPSQIEWW